MLNRMCILHQTLCCSCIWSCTTKQLLCCVETLRRAADKMQTGHTLRTMGSYILHLPLQLKNKGHIYSNCFEVIPRTLCLRVQVDSVWSQAVCFMSRSRSWAYGCEINTLSCQIPHFIVHAHAGGFIQLEVAQHSNRTVNVSLRT